MAAGHWLVRVLVAAAMTVTISAAAAVPASENLDNVVVNIPGLGSLLGYTNFTHSQDRKVHCFLGVRFVEPPERFERPSAYFNWLNETEPRNALARGPMCPQGKFYPYELEANEAAASWVAADSDDWEDEDCLTLDIYTPATAQLNASATTRNLLPVLLFFHGGAFVRGSSISVRPDFVLDHNDGRDFVIVSAQYRLGPLGFLAPGGSSKGGLGNHGLYDQMWALNWVRQYVRSFGGDPNKIVIGGVSAGGATSGLLYVSPLTNGFIRGAMLFSGCAVSPWTVDPTPRRSARGLARHAGCEFEADAVEEAEAAAATGELLVSDVVSAEDGLVDCLRNASVEALLNATWLWAREEKAQGRVGMGGTIPALDGEEGMLPRMPRDILSDESFKAKPLLIGITREEGLYLYVQLDAFYMDVNGLKDNQQLLRQDMGDVMLEFAGIEDDLRVLGHAVQQLYFHEHQLGDYLAMTDGVIDFTGAAFFKAPARYMAQLNADRGAKAWLYSFDYVSSDERAAARSASRKPRVNHGADQAYLFPARNQSFNYENDDYSMAVRFSRMVADFVTNLSPIPDGETRVEGAEWPPHSRANDVYMSIGQNGWELKRDFTREYHVTNNRSGRAAGAAPLAALLAAAVLVFGLARAGA